MTSYTRCQLNGSCKYLFKVVLGAVESLVNFLINMPSSLALCGYVSQRDVFFFWIWESGCQAADYFLFVEDKLDSA